MNHFQVLLSSLTCAATKRVVVAATDAMNEVLTVLNDRMRSRFPVDGQGEAGGLLRSSTPPTLTTLLLLRASVLAVTLKMSRAPIKVKCLFSMTLIPGRGRYTRREQRERRAD